MKILLELLLIALVALAVSRAVAQPWRGRLFSALKVWLTVRMVWLLSVWPMQLEDGSSVPAWQLVLDTARAIDPRIFVTFLVLAVGVKLVGIGSSMLRWLLILRGQGIDFPFRHIFGTFLIGRAIGFFLPSTVGLDAYMLYDAARFSGRTVEVTAGKFLEKVIGFSGIFLSFLVALPFGVALFGEHGTTVAAITVPLASGIIAALMVLLWFPGLVQWGLENVPIPAKARLHALLTRASRASAAYRDKKGLVVMLFVLSFLVHFTTAAMYYFTALAVGAGDRAEFWPIAFGSSIQIFATVIGPTIGGIGIREAVQLATLGGMLGAGPAILSASLGFLAAEAPTVLGFVIWLVRGDAYRPGYCRVDGEQVDYDASARAAMSLETETERVEREAATGDTPSFGERARRAGAYGLGAGILSGLLLALPEAAVIARGGFGEEAQVLWFGPLAYAALFGGLGLLGGLVLAVLPMERDEIRGWTASLALIACVVPLGLAITVFRLRRDAFAEQMPPLPVLLGVLAAFGALAALLLFAGPRLFRGRLGALVRPGVALALLAAIGAGGALASRLVAGGAGERPAPPAIPAALAGRPNVLLVMVDTLRADHLSCGEAAPARTPNLCRLVEDGGSQLQGFSHASWTKPATASLLTSLLPTSHGAMSKPSALPAEVVTLAEAMGEHGYTTGGVVSNINLAESFGFAQGFDEYVYLGPDYLLGARESSSKLILYQIARSVWFKLKGGGLRFGDFYQDSTVVNRVAVDFFERHRDSRFFYFLHYMDPHDPYFRHPYDGHAIARVSNPDPPAELAEEMKQLYVGEVEFLDEQFGKLLARLDALGLYDETAIALVSDHGEEFHEHGGFWHGLTLYDEQIHVPLLVKWPQGQRAPLPRDARSEVARLIDVAPTLLALTGADIPAAMQGRDLAAGWETRSEAERLVFAEEDHEGNVLRAVRTRDWKWLEANPGNPRGLPEEELFHVARDRGETRNRLAEEPRRAAELSRHAEAQQQLAERARVDGETVELSDAELQNLKALGYVVE